MPHADEQDRDHWRPPTRRTTPIRRSLGIRRLAPVRCATIGRDDASLHVPRRRPRSDARRELADLARRAEAIGFHALVIPDHLIPQLSPVPAMATIAAATTRSASATFVLNNDLRHPAVLAQDLATLDVLRRAGSTSRSAPAGTGPSTTRSACRSTRRGRAAPVSPRRSRSSRAASPTGRSASPASTTRSPTTTPAQAGPAAAPAVLDRRRRPADARTGRPRGGHRRPGAADRSAAAAVGPAEHHVRGDGREDRLGARGRGRPVRRSRSSTSTRRRGRSTVTDDAARRGTGRSSTT